MSVKAKVYIAAILALGAAALVHGLGAWQPQNLLRFGLCLALAIPASCLKVALPGNTGTMSVLFLFLLAGVVEVGLAETLMIATTCAVVQSFWHAKVRPRAVQVAFTVANLAFAVTAAHWVYHSRWLPVTYLEAPFRLAATASVFFLTNTFGVATVIALTEHKSLRRVWREFYWWSFPYYLVGAAIVGGFSFANRLLQWQVWLLILPVVYVIYRSYHLYLNQLEAERRRAEEERRHAENERRHAEEVAVFHSQTVRALQSATIATAKLNAVIQASPLAILGVDGTGKVTSWNTTAERMFGWSEEEALNKPLPCAGERSEEVIQEVVDRTLRGELLSGVELTQWRKDGSPVEAAIWTAPLRHSDTKILGILIAVADVSDRRRLEEQLRLSQKMEAVGRLAGGVAHDFNNLLTIISGYGTMLLESVKHDAFAANQAEEILNASSRAAELVAKLLTFSRRQVIKPKPLDVNELVQGIEGMLQRLIGEHIQLRSVLDPHAGWIVADPNQMETALMNLATNARDAMPGGGVLSIETGRTTIDEERNPLLPDLPHGTYVRLSVRDTGHGMDADTQEHIFEPFFTTKQRGKGTGLGLSSVYGGVEQNGGRIFVSSAVGRGTTFSIYLPHFERAVCCDVQRVSFQKLPRGSETILLVEDEIALRRMVREALTTAGYRVWEAGNGAEALEYWAGRVGEIDLLVTDVVMPIMNGVKLAEELRRQRPGLEVVFMSGHATDMITRQGVLDPDVELLQKPFLPVVLVRKVREVLDRAAKRDRPDMVWLYR